MIKLRVKARRSRAQIKIGDVDIKRLTAWEGVSPAYVTRVVRLAFLSPKVFEVSWLGLSCKASTQRR